MIRRVVKVVLMALGAVWTWWRKKKDRKRGKKAGHESNGEVRPPLP